MIAKPFIGLGVNFPAFPATPALPVAPTGRPVPPAPPAVIPPGTRLIVGVNPDGTIAVVALRVIVPALPPLPELPRAPPAPPAPPSTVAPLVVITPVPDVEIVLTPALPLAVPPWPPVEPEPPDTRSKPPPLDIVVAAPDVIASGTSRGKTLLQILGNRPGRICLGHKSPGAHSPRSGRIYFSTCCKNCVIIDL